MERRSVADTGVCHSLSERPSANAAKPAAPSSMRAASDSPRRFTERPIVSIVALLVALLCWLTSSFVFGIANLLALPHLKLSWNVFRIRSRPLTRVGNELAQSPSTPEAEVPEENPNSSKNCHHPPRANVP